MGIRRLNHAVLYVSDVGRSTEFYREVLGFRPKPSANPAQAVFAQAADSDNDHDLALFSKNAGQQRAGVFSPSGEPPAANEPPAGLYHLAWEVDSLPELKRIRDQLAALGRLGLEEDHGAIRSVYGHDPDGLLFEVTWVVPASELQAADRQQQTRALDWARDLQRFAHLYASAA
ncbi:VOC family protein [Vogesella sp. LIG4]|uniref:VOC family protein n=1 Tax=Vogesella sp. LIG4 TaxID=1192162 RepID=UPI00081F7861|nr:VOC family protein [Vogesella sp. LIG4]SCK26733.1 Catechol 2,3-dioxygenase [Vogesella sp. LIG4]